MGILEAAGLLLTVAAVFAYINHRWLRLPTTIGLMLIGLVFSVGLIVVGRAVPAVEAWATETLGGIDFNATLMEGMLGFLLFAGALHVDINDLARQKLVVALLATVGVVLSAVLVGVATWLILNGLGIEARFVMCLLFGALISPTDPIAVLGVLKRLGAPADLQTTITGESLFNDGVAVVVFLAILDFASAPPGAATGAAATAVHVAMLFVQESLGGAAFGLVLGWVAYRMLRSINQYQVEVLISLALACGGYVLANRLHVSGPIAMVVAGLLIGNHGRALAMSTQTREHLDSFWELIDEVLNAVLFALLGLEVIVLTFTGRTIVAGAVMIPAVLGARFVAVGVPVLVLRAAKRRLPAHLGTILTWSGLRGGISVALALSIPKRVHEEPTPERQCFLAMTYIVVAFSILIQGLTIQPLVRRLAGPSGEG